jgi:hypothetical protein
MGGTICITLRDTKDNEYRMDRSTGIISFYLNNIHLYQNDEKHIQDFLKTWLEMKED